jgi:predicted nucleotidyltransferase
MMNSLIDISGKLDADSIALIAWVHEVCSAMGLDVLLIGALARDIHFLHCHGIQPGRATEDIDFAILMPDWGTYEHAKSRLLQHSGYEQDTHHLQRLRTSAGLLMDLIPFGGIESPSGTLRWPPAFTHVMSTIGFQDALKSSLICRVTTAPALEIRIVSIPGIAALKLISWADNYPERRKDAFDLCFILTHYLDAGQSDRLWHEESDLTEVPDFDYESAGARLLGRDVARMASPETRHRLKDILTEELRPDGHHRLIGQWELHEGESEAKLFSILEHFMMGLGEMTENDRIAADS